MNHQRHCHADAANVQSHCHARTMRSETSLIWPGIKQKNNNPVSLPAQLAILFDDVSVFCGTGLRKGCASVLKIHSSKLIMSGGLKTR